MEASHFILLPVIGALIGWCTNWLAVKMIFRPRRPRSMLGFRIEGLLPRRRSDLARSVARTVEQDLLSVDEIQDLVKKLAEGEGVRRLLHERVDLLINEQLGALGPMVKVLVSEELLRKIKARIEEEILRFIGGLSAELHGGIAERLDIHEMVRERIEGFDLMRLEEIVFRIAARELRHIEVLGGVLGFVVGIVEAVVVGAL